MNKYILTLATFSILLFGVHQLMSMDSPNQEHQLQLNECLIEATRTMMEDRDAVIALLERGADVNHANSSGDTALIYAAFYGHTDIVRLLIEHGADVNHVNNIGNTALIAAARCGHVNIVGLLMEAGAGVNRVGFEGRTAIIWAAAGERTFAVAAHAHIDIVKLLLDHGAQVNHRDSENYTALTLAADREQTDIVRLLVRYGTLVPSDVMDRYRIKQALTPGSISPLAQAIIMRDREDITRILAEAPMGVNTQYDFGMTALHWAVAQNYEELVQELLTTYKLDLNVQDNEGNTPLHHAARNGNISVIKLLLAAGACLDNNNYDGYTAWGLANGQSQLSPRTERGELLARAAEFLERNAAQTILWNVTRAGRHEGCLGDLPAEVTAHIAGYVMARDNRGNTPLHIAILYNNIHDVTRLLNDRANVYTRNDDGNTPLHIAIQQNNADIVQALLLHDREDRELRNKKNQTPFDVASEHRNSNIIAMLNRHKRNQTVDVELGEYVYRGTPRLK